MGRTKKKRLKFLGMGVLLFLTLSCTKGLRFVDSTMLKPHKVHLIKRGSTTKEELIREFGKPESTVSIDKGRESLFYKDLNLRSLWVELNKEGVVSDYKYSGK